MSAPGASRFTAAQRSRPNAAAGAGLFLIVAPTVVLVVVGLVMLRTDAQWGAALLVTAGGVVVVLAALLTTLVVGVGQAEARRIRRITLRRPGALVISTETTPDVIAALSVIAGHPIGFGLVGTMSFGDAGLEFWNSRDEDPVAGIPRSRVMAVRPGVLRVSTGSVSQQRYALLVDTATDHGPVTIPIALRKPGIRTVLNTDPTYANQILQEFAARMAG